MTDFLKENLIIVEKISSYVYACMLNISYTKS